VNLVGVEACRPGEPSEKGGGDTGHASTPSPEAGSVAQHDEGLWFNANRACHPERPSARELCGSRRGDTGHASTPSPEAGSVAQHDEGLWFNANRVRHPERPSARELCGSRRGDTVHASTPSPKSGSVAQHDGVLWFNAAGLVTLSDLLRVNCVGVEACRPGEPSEAGGGDTGHASTPSPEAGSVAQHDGVLW
jgi:hypothetical protein